MPFVKLDCDIVKSTMWSYDPATKVVWITLLAEASWEGVVVGTITGLARIANVPLEDTKKAFEIFLAPDPDSTSPEHDGRRIEKTDRGWKILNFERYRDLGSSEKKREADRVRIAEKRESAKSDVGNSPVIPHMSRPVAKSRNPSPNVAKVAYTDTDKDPDRILDKNRIEAGCDFDPEEAANVARSLFKNWPRFAPSREREENAVGAFVRGVRSRADLIIFKVAFEEYTRVLETWPEDTLKKAFNMETFFTTKYANYLPEWFDASQAEESLAAHQASDADEAPPKILSHANED